MRHLWDLLAADRLHHAWLFEGPDGVGRRLVALRLAMAANCEQRGAPPAMSLLGPPVAPALPCGVCPTCRRIAGGNHPDVVWVEPNPETASRQIPVDRVREVIRAASLHRYGARRRFIVFDPAEALQEGAANALLKTLEEPVPDTHFILIARHASGLLPTIVSRCQRLRFAPVPEAELAPWLAERGVAAPIAAARLAEGCPGRALAWTTEAMEAREALRDGVLGAIAGDLTGLFQHDETLTEGGRAASADTIDQLLQVIEDLLRAVVRQAAGHAEEGPLAPVVEAWHSALWPSGVVACQRALLDARADLHANVTPKTALDALLTRLATELGAARKAKPRPA